MAFFLSLYIIVGLILYLNQNRFIYFPSEAVHHSFKTITMQNDGADINIIVLNPEKLSKSAIVYFGGNGESVVYNSPDFLREFNNTTTYLMNYRGYDESTGKANEKDNYQDALKLFDYAKDKHKDIIVMGRSLGSGVATYIASKRDVSKLVLITPYDSIKNLAQAKIIVYPMSLLLNQQYLSVNRAKDITADTLVLIAENDTAIPLKNSNNLLKALSKAKVESIIIKDTGHNSISNNPLYFNTLSNFVTK